MIPPFVICPSIVVVTAKQTAVVSVFCSLFLSDAMAAEEIGHQYLGGVGYLFRPLFD
jgi:hypothetical protein